MGRHRYREGRGGGVPNQRDTPVKAAPSRRAKCRRPVHNRYEDIPEEPEMEEVKTVLLFSPAGHSAVQVTPGSEAFKVGERPVEVTMQNVTVTLGSITSSEPTFSSDDEEEEEEEEEEEDCYSSATSSSSISSPEIFRRDGYAETLTSFKDELLGLHLHKKNSTLLDVSHAESIRMHSPNLSNIIDVSPILAEKNCEIDKSRGPKAEPKIHADPFKSEKWKTPPKLPKRKPIYYKKKVCFQTPIKMEPLEPKHSPEEASFFDFLDDADRDSFFRRMSTRSEKLRSAPLFPLAALEDEDPSAQ